MSSVLPRPTHTAWFVTFPSNDIILRLNLIFKTDSSASDILIWPNNVHTYDNCPRMNYFYLDTTQSANNRNILITLASPLYRFINNM